MHTHFTHTQDISDAYRRGFLSNYDSISRLELQIYESHSSYDHLHDQEDFTNDLQWPMDKLFYLENKEDQANESGGGNGNC